MKNGARMGVPVAGLLWGLAGAWVATGAESGESVLPAQVLNLENWKLTLPVGQEKKANEVPQPELARFRHPDFFFATTGGVVFIGLCGGITTTTSPYPRSELREMIQHGTKKASWSTAEGVHEMFIREAITRTPAKKPHVVAGQIHSLDDDVTVIRLEGKRLYITDGDNSHGYLLDDDYRLGTFFTITIRATAGVISYEYNGKPVDYTLRKKVDGCFFKAGCYTQSSVKRGDKPDAAGEVVIRELKVRHEPPL